jgi:hypothetical protein
MAIGSAMLLGIRFPVNFAAPYTAGDLIDFWRRWHISLSTWLRDYLYVPLGGNRRGPVRTYLNLMITMLLGGLWHGASWTFVVWGGLHGAGLALNRWLRDRFGFDPDRRRWSRVLGVVVTFHFVSAAWIFFRSSDFAAARLFYERLATLTTYHPNLDPRVVGVLIAGLACHFVPHAHFERAKLAFGALGSRLVYLQATEYAEAYHHLGLTLSTGIYGSTFFMLTGFHGFHVTLGAIMLVCIWLRTMKGHFTPERHFAFEAVAWYWHFVDVVWLGLFIFVYWI